MSNKDIRAGLETRLAEIAPALATAYENMQYSPAGNVPFQRVYLLPATSSNPSIGALLYRASGIFQVTLFYPLNKGPGPAEARAELIFDKFKRGSTMIAGGVLITIDQSPSILQATVDGDRWALPVQIPYRANIF